MRLKKILEWVVLSIGTLSGIIAIAQIIGYLNIFGEMRKMFEFLFIVKVNLFWVTVTITGTLCIFSFVAYKMLKSYNEFAEQTKPPSDIISIEAHRLAKPVREKDSKYPSLRFSLEVINRSYYSFEPERVEITCYNDGEKVGEAVWDKDANKEKEYVSDRKYITVGEQLPKYGESYIRFEVPIEKEYNRLGRWDLNGHAKYTNGEKTLTIAIDTMHFMSKQAEEDLEKMVKAAIGGESK